MEQLLNQYGYLVIFVLTLFEGETVLIIAGILAYQGLLNIELSILAAFLGSTIGDQMFFHFARHEGYRFVKRFKYIWALLPRAEEMVKKHGTSVVLFARYLYGLRIAIVVMCGLVKMRSIRFSAYNVLAALVWAVSYAFVGYFLSKAIGAVVGITNFELVLSVAIAVAAVTYWIVRTARLRRKTQAESFESSKANAERPDSKESTTKEEE